jgi:hypothetical protein
LLKSTDLGHSVFDQAPNRLDHLAGRGFGRAVSRLNQLDHVVTNAAAKGQIHEVLQRLFNTCVFDILVWPTSMLGNGPPVMV